jgi:hypothetical protein
VPSSAPSRRMRARSRGDDNRVPLERGTTQPVKRLKPMAWAADLLISEGGWHRIFRISW